MATKKRNPSSARYFKTSSIKEENGLQFTRRLFVMRHGERCDFAFGKQWVARSFDEKGNYTQADLNLPVSLIPRDSQNDFLKDSPLTELGMFQARSTGQALRRADVDIKHVYSSPSFRCVQTAQNVIDGMQSNAKICIEPSAFEWCGWYKNGMPSWLSPAYLSSHGYRVNAEHKPLMEAKDLKHDETVPEYYDRCHKLVQHILKLHEEDGGDILIVAHAGSLDTFTRQLCGKKIRTSQEMHQILCNFTYCCLCCLAYYTKPGKWLLTNPPIPTLQEFDWKVLL
ncbi:ecdysteroid-phosphate phosphatase-like isoform X2 [Physella acuta]|nr:ecdysteroid-phosphate phosphatase-like isoform X2 [Physella acuta]XP_059163206.1 ecdysteroid-phosphate phosphatase-like isoform X2 [Physella acuta]